MLRSQIILRKEEETSTMKEHAATDHSGNKSTVHERIPRSVQNGVAHLGKVSQVVLKTCLVFYASECSEHF